MRQTPSAPGRGRQPTTGPPLWRSYFAEGPWPSAAIRYITVVLLWR